MPKTFTRPFPQTQRTASAVCTAAGAITTDAPTGTVLLYTAPAEGALITKLTAMPRATVTASSLHAYISKDSGTTQRMKTSALMAAYTQATTTQTPITSFSDVTETTPIRLEGGDRVYVQSEVALAGGIVFSAEISEF